MIVDMDGYAVELGEIRPDEFPAAAQLVARAMRDLPYSIAIWHENPERRHRGLEHLMELYLPRMKAAAVVARRGDVLVGIVGIAPPGTCVPRLGESLALVPPLLMAGPRDFLRLNAYFNGTWRHDARTPHWHIGPVAVEPAVHGLGVGTTLMRELGRRLDRSQELAHLETDLPENVSFYERLGFETVGVEAVTGVQTWFMDRHPGANGGAVTE